jgi:hypothetical protein
MLTPHEENQSRSFELGKGHVEVTRGRIGGVHVLWGWCVEARSPALRYVVSSSLSAGIRVSTFSKPNTIGDNPGFCSLFEFLGRSVVSVTLFLVVVLRTRGPSDDRFLGSLAIIV